MEADGDLEVKLVLIGNACQADHFSGALETAVSRVPTEGASAAIYEITTKHPGGRPPGKAHGIHADDWAARAAARNHDHQRRAASAAMVRAQIPHSTPRPRILRLDCRPLTLLRLRVSFLLAAPAARSQRLRLHRCLRILRLHVSLSLKLRGLSRSTAGL